MTRCNKRADHGASVAIAQTHGSEQKQDPFIQSDPRENHVGGHRDTQTQTQQFKPTPDNAINRSPLYCASTQRLEACTEVMPCMKVESCRQLSQRSLPSLLPSSASNARNKGHPSKAGERKEMTKFREESIHFFKKSTHHKRMHGAKENTGKATHPPLDTETVEIYVARHGRCSYYGTEEMKS